jgi:predicted Zn-ribbon and HTH transcriptional regulator
MPDPERVGRLDLADIVRAHRAELESVRRLGRRHQRVLTDIANCRTAALGGHLDRCLRCGYEHPAYNSCRNRHCPKCQALAQEKWIEEQRTRLLDVPHFHVVFTLPAELRPLAAFAPCTIYDALFHAAASTLKSFARSRLSATLGATLVLHTWTRKLELHPHVHAIVTGGGLTRDGASWCAASQSFLFPVNAMSRVLRGKMMARLRRAHRAGSFKQFSEFRDPQAFARLMRAIAKLPWYVYAKPSFSRSEYVLQYLGRYTHRVGLANSRLLSVSEAAVTFRTKGSGTLTLPPLEFLRRFLLHVLPDRFHKIRHIGLYANRKKRARVHALLGTSAPRRVPRAWRERLFALTGRDVSRCPSCQAQLFSIALPAIRAPPEARR